MGGMKARGWARGGGGGITIEIILSEIDVNIRRVQYIFM